MQIKKKRHSSSFLDIMTNANTSFTHRVRQLVLINLRDRKSQRGKSYRAWRFKSNFIDRGIGNVTGRARAKLWNLHHESYA